MSEGASDSSAQIPAAGLYPHRWDVDRARRSPNISGRPTRPSLSIVLATTIASWLAIRIVGHACLAAAIPETTWWGLDPQILVFIILAALSGILLIGSFALARFRAIGLLIIAGLVAGAFAGTLSMRTTLSASEALTAEPLSRYTFCIESDPRMGSTGRWYVQASVAGAASSDVRVWIDISTSIASGARDADLLPALGTLIRCTGRWSQLDLTDDFDASLISRGIAARAYATTMTEVGTQHGLVGGVRRFRSGVLATLDPYASEPRSLIAGVTCGMQSALSAFPLRSTFSDLGLSHLVAVSGTHLSLVAMLLGTVVKRSHGRPLARLVLCGSILGIYVIFTGFQNSAIRAWVMSISSLGATVVGRRSHAISAVAVAALIMLLIEPTCAAQTGFQLSVLSVGGLAVFAPLATAWVRCAMPRFVPEDIYRAPASTLVAQLSTIPITLPQFGSITLLAPFANMLVGPLVSALLLLGVMTLPIIAVFPQIAPLILAPCDGIAAAVCWLANVLVAFPGTLVVVDVSSSVLFTVLIPLACVIYIVWPRPCRSVIVGSAAVIAAVGLACGLSWRFFAPARMVVLDVGQGDAILIQDGSFAMLVDTGPDDAVVYALARNHVLHLDAVVFTHTHEDHVGGFDELIRRVPVDQVIVGWGTAAGLDEVSDELSLALEKVSMVAEVGAGDIICASGVSFEVVWPKEPLAGSENEDSVVALVRIEDKSKTLLALMTGDAERDVIGELAQAGAIGQIDVLKVGHHGSAVSLTEDLMDVLDPIVAVASAGEHNRYGHPRQECIDIIEGHGTRFLCTIDAGDVDLRPEDEGVSVRCQKAAA